MSTTIFDLVERYVLAREITDSTADYYRRLARVLSGWAQHRIAVSEFTPDLANRFLYEKQCAGRSSYYRKSLRNGLRALLGFAHGPQPRGTLRPVKLDELEPEAWSEAEIVQLCEACHEMPVERREYWQTLIPVAYYTGLSQIDLHRVERSHFDAAGVIRFRRSKTGKRVVAAVPVELLAALDTRPAVGPMWPQRISREALRRTFARIVKRAKLRGSFKKLRKSSGTAVEALHPGRGHEHLANSRQVFERHYLDHGKSEPAPLSPAPLDRLPRLR